MSVCQVASPQPSSDDPPPSADEASHHWGSFPWLSNCWPANCKMFVTISVASAGALLLAFTHNHKSCWPGLAYTLPWPLCSTFCKHGMVWYGHGRLGSLRFESMSITTMSQGAHCWQAVWAAVARLLRMPSEKLAVSTWACSCSRLELIGHITLQLASRNKEPQLVPQPQAYHQKIIKQLTQT